MHATSRMGALRDDRRRKRMEHKVEDVEREAGRLQIENDTLKDELQQQRVELSRLLDIFEAGNQEPAGSAERPRRHRVRRVMTLGMVAGGAYVAGAKAGHEGLVRMRDGLNRMTHKGREDMADMSAAVAERAEAASEHIASGGWQSPHAPGSAI